MQNKKRDPTTGARLQTWERAGSDIKPIKPDDAMQAVIRSGINTIERERKHGAVVYPDTAAGLEQFRRDTECYFRMIEAHNAALGPEDRGMLCDIEGWAIYLGIARQTIFNYHKRGAEWRHFIDLVKDIIAAAKKQAANDFKTPPVFTIFDLKCNHGYIEKSELQITTAAALSDAELESRIDESGLVWDAESGEYVPC